MPREGAFDAGRSESKIDLNDFVVHASKKFDEVGIDSAQVDAELLAGHVLGLSRGEVQAQMISGSSISELQATELAKLFARRAAREPLQHITGKAYFRSLELVVGPGVFIPRPETELIAQLAIDALHVEMAKKSSSSNPIAVDLGTGSGAIALSMATEVQGVNVFAVEKSKEAFAFTQKNFALHGSEKTTLFLGDLGVAFPELDGTVFVVASNPPYIPASAIPRDLEVKLHDPGMALYGGEDGMQVMREVSKTAGRLLHDGGFLVVEHADTQGAQVCELLLADGWSEVKLHQDLTGRDRAVSAVKGESRR